ncbi:MAG: alanine--tRNA ligase [Desulfobacterales bacterium]|nr:alanine--tRNA ligase [Desulfobacterales bacterium]
MTGNDVREKFLEYFKTHDHQIVRSSSLAPHDDPTLLFTNAGMVQFKRIFLGEESRSYQRATTSQKCVRAGGKHNDLENVGYTARHHTFFEMLGNFSFGDYFKEQAIEYCWDLLTNGYGLSREKLWVSVYLDDDESHRIWQENIGLPENRIARFGEKDNFWSMGDTGPCGPCSEVLIDRGEEFGCHSPDCRVGCECDRFLELWNLVFMQFNRDASGQMTPLPKPSIDTGMGLERIVSIIQNAASNYGIDLFMPIIRKIEDLSETAFGESANSDVAMKVISDHSRAAAFLVCDGVLPSNEGRGYVLRRIIRRAIRYGRNIGLGKPFLHDTAAVVFDIMKPAYPELTASAAFITNVIENEEVRFLETLDNGLKLLNDTLLNLKAKGLHKVPGEIIFKLYDTFGFPVDIVRDVVRDEKMELDMGGFNAAMEMQRTKSRSVATFSTLGDAYKNLSAQGIFSKFVGYDEISAHSKVLLLAKNGKEISEAVPGETVEIVTEITPFYGQSGGQVGDTGKISRGNTSLDVAVCDTIKDPTGLIVHQGKILAGTLQPGDEVFLCVDKKKREATALNHTVTHILHHALRRVLGDHVKQAGSLVAPERLRFDFTHFSQIDSQTLDEIECVVNDRIRENVPVKTSETGVEAALKSGATALFEEKYGDTVRVVSLAEFSKELCGGTHTERTGNIGLFKICSESSVAAGVRRIEAVTGKDAVAYVQQTANIVQDIARQIKEKPDALAGRVEKILAHLKSVEKELENVKTKISRMREETAEDDVRSIHGINVLVKKVSAGTPPSELREMADRFKEKLKSGVVVLGCASGPKVQLVAVVTKDITDRISAGGIVQAIAPIVGGGGGGRADMAQAGGSKPDKLDAALENVYSLLDDAGGRLIN